jgi:DNA-binding MarR family transcriptional regulator
MGIQTPDAELPDSGLPDNALPDADERAWDGLAALHTRVEQQLAKALQRRHGLGLSDYRALSRLAAADKGGMRISELADALALNESSVSRLADRLEQAGLTERCICEDDRRGVYAFITDAGRDGLAAAAPTYRTELAAALDAAATDPGLAAPVTALRTTPDKGPAVTSAH